jgi:biopolymer transport protein ExbB
MRTILTWYGGGGPMMAPLALVAVAGLLVLVERVVHVVRQSRVHARPFMERVISLARADRYDEALSLCASHQSALPDLGLVILRSRGSDESALLNVAEASALSVVPQLERRIEWINAFAVVAVLFGALGAIVNLHDSLVAVSTGAVEGDALARALPYAMRPLGAGVTIAIPLVLGHAFVKSVAGTLAQHLSEFSARLINAVLDRPDVRLGHR